MAQIRKITRSNPLSDFRNPQAGAGSGLSLLADTMAQAYEFLAPAATKEMERQGQELGRELARQQIGDPEWQAVTYGGGGPVGAPSRPGSLTDLVDRKEGGGRYDTLFGHSQRAGGAFAGVDVTKMTLAQLRQFQSPSGNYGKWVKANNPKGVLATPIGRYQIVGTTLNAAAREMGLPDDTLFTPTVQDALFHHLAGKRLRGPLSMQGKLTALRQEWDGFNHVPDSQLAAAIRDYETGGVPMPPRPDALSGGGGTDTLLGGEGDDQLTPEAAPLMPGGEQTVMMPKATMLRDADGKLASRMFSPLSGPMLQAHNAAAAADYQQSILVKSVGDLMTLSRENPMDPQGFMEAAQGYADGIIEQAPDQFQGDLRASLDKEIQRRFLGIVEERQSDIRKRAANSNSALVDRWQTNLADALVSGNPDEIGAARSELESALRVRESLPGLSWSRDQSINTVLDAERTAEAHRARQMKARVADLNDKLKLVEEAAYAGANSVHDGLLDDPGIWATNPEAALDAAAAREMADQMPFLLGGTPAQVAEALALRESVPVADDSELRVRKAMRNAAEIHRKAWENDPIAAAEQYLPPDQKPPQLPEPDMSDPDAFTAGLRARAEYARKLRNEGYTNGLSVLSNEEAATFAPAFSKEVPAVMRAAAMGAATRALGDASGSFFKQVAASDPVTRMAGMLMSRAPSVSIGGAMVTDGPLTQIATEMFQGQELLSQNIGAKVSADQRQTAISGELKSALDLARVPIPARGDIVEAAAAIYAFRAQGLSNDDGSLDDIWAEAVQAAMGQTKNPHTEKLLGGTQDIGGHMTLLPVGVSGVDLTDGMEGMFQTRVVDGRGVSEASDLPWMELGMKSAPMVDGQRIPLRSFRDGNIVLVPVPTRDGSNIYRMMQKIGDGDPEYLQDSDGRPYDIDIDRVIAR